jgi:hypothetical protein
MGVSATAFSVDRGGKPTVPFHKNATLPFTQKKNRRLKIMSTYVDLMYATRAQAKPGSARWVPTRAAEDPLAMLELLVAKCLEEYIDTVQSSSAHVNKDSLTRPKVHPLRMLSIFKDRLKSEDNILRFYLLTLNDRCVEILRNAQAVCVKESPLDYPMEEYDGDTHLNGCISNMLAGMAGLARSQPTRFTEACRIVKEVIETEGSIENEKANTRCFLKVDDEKIVIDNFRTPPEDNLLLSDRAHFGRIIIADADDGPGSFLF